LAKRTKQEVVAEFRRAEILRAARKVFAREGFEAAAVDDIAEAAGLAKGTVYVYFHSKRDMYLAGLKQGVAALAEKTKQNIDAAATPAEKIKAFITTRLQFADENREFAAMYFPEYGNTPSTCFQKEFKNLYLQQIRPLEEALQQASLHGEIRRISPDAAVFFVYEMTRALIRHRLLGWSTGSADEKSQSVFDLIWKGLGASCDPSREEVACTRSC
jgi:AcrR family transcriptional regulator